MLRTNEETKLIPDFFSVNIKDQMKHLPSTGKSLPLLSPNQSLSSFYFPHHGLRMLFQQWHHSLHLCYTHIILVLLTTASLFHFPSEKSMERRACSSGASCSSAASRRQARLPHCRHDQLSNSHTCSSHDNIQANCTPLPSSWLISTHQEQQNDFFSHEFEAKAELLSIHLSQRVSCLCPTTS